MALTQWLPVQLTEEEVRERANAMALAVRELARAEMERSDAAGMYRERIKALKNAISNYGDQVEHRKEQRNVEVEDRIDYKHKVSERYRLDTGEVIATRPLTPEEKQRGLPLKAPGVDTDE